MQNTFRRTSSSPHARTGAHLLLVALLGLLGVLAGCGSRASPGAPATHPRLTPPPARPTSPVALFRLQMIDATTGWAIANGGSALLRTTSGPLHWQEVTPTYDTTTLTISASAFFDSQHAWVTVAPLPGVGAPLRPFAIWRTTDGGQHWQQSLVRSPGYEIGDLFFLSPRLGWVAVQRIMGGDKTNAIGGLDLFRTLDGGATWTLVSTTSESPHVGPGVQTVELEGAGLVFTSPTQGWLVGLAGILRRDGGTNPLRIYRTQDGGVTWHPQELPLTSPQVYTVGLLPPTFFHRGVEGIMPAFVSASSGSTLALYTTGDGGASWSVASPAAQSTGPFPMHIDFVERQHGWISGDRLYRTEDGGQHWTAFPLPEEARSQGFLDLDFVSETLGWAISIVSQTKQVLLLQTTDGGQTWRVVTPTVAAL